MHNLNWNDNTNNKHFSFPVFAVSPAACFAGSAALTYDITLTNSGSVTSVPGMTNSVTTCASGKCIVGVTGAATSPANGDKYVLTSDITVIGSYSFYIYAKSPGQAVELWSNKITYNVVCTAAAQTITWASAYTPSSLTSI